MMGEVFKKAFTMLRGSSIREAPTKKIAIELQNIRFTISYNTTHNSKLTPTILYVETKHSPLHSPQLDCFIPVSLVIFGPKDY